MTPRQGAARGQTWDRSERRSWAVALGLAVATLLTYANTVPGQFVWDDVPIVVQGTITRGEDALPRALLHPDEVKPYYRPLTRASYVLDAALWGTHPPGFHVVNVALQAANVVLLFLLLSRLLGRIGVAAGAAALLAVHPINVETVAFVSARNNLLVLFFLLSSALLLLRRLQGGGGLAQWGSALAWFLALASKESAMPGGAGLVALALFGPMAVPKGWASRLSLLAPHLVLSIAYLTLRTMVVGWGGGGGLEVNSPLEILRLNFQVIPRYLELVLLPARLTIFHHVPAAGLHPIGLLMVAWGLIAVGLVFLLLQGSRTSLLGLAWFVLNFVPVANIVAIPSAVMAERFLYVPAVGLWVIAADQAVRLRDRPAWRPYVAPAVAVVLVVLAVVTARRNLAWRDDVSLFAAAVSAEPRSVAAHYNLGIALQERGDLAGAGAAWSRALDVDPRDGGTLAQLGTLSAVQGDLATAERRYRDALAVGHRVPEVHLNLARVCERTGRLEEALRHYEEAFRSTIGRDDEVARTAQEAMVRLRGAGPR